MKMSKKLITLLCVLAMVLSLSVPAFAATVSYDDVSEKFVFSAENQENPTDLFDNFKNAMPGDTLNQEIVIENKNTNRMNLKVFLKSLGADEQSKDFLSKLTLSVKEKDNSPFFTASADSNTGLSDYKELGTIAPGGSITLVLSLEIPKTLGNEYQNATGKITWQFKSEEQPIETVKHICDKCGHQMYPVTVFRDGEEYVVYRCDCGNEEEMRCEICGSRMHKVLVQGNDGKYYYYYECNTPEKHRTPVEPVSPKTGDFLNVNLLSCILCVAFIGLTASIILLSKKREEDNE